MQGRTSQQAGQEKTGEVYMLSLTVSVSFQAALMGEALSTKHLQPFTFTQNRVRFYCQVNRVTVNASSIIALVLRITH